MTTYASFYVLEGEEILIYRRMLELWAATAERIRPNAIDHLIHKTFDSTGKDSLKVEEYVPALLIFPLLELMRSERDHMIELEDAALKSPLDEKHFEISRQLFILERVMDKIRNTEASSMYISNKPNAG